MSKKCGNITVQISHIVLIYALFLFPSPTTSLPPSPSFPPSILTPTFPPSLTPTLLFPLDMPLLHTWQRITLECTFAYMNVYVGVCVGIPPCVFIPES